LLNFYVIEIGGPDRDRTDDVPWSVNGSRRLILKQLATGILVNNGYIGRYFRPISGQIFIVHNSRAAWWGVHADHPRMEQTTTNTWKAPPKQSTKAAGKPVKKAAA